MVHVEEKYDVVIIGAGHAGCEAALASARLGNNTIVFSIRRSGSPDLYSTTGGTKFSIALRSFG